MRHASGHNYRNSSSIVDVAMRQIPRSTERISSLVNISKQFLRDVWEETAPNAIIWTGLHPDTTREVIALPRPP